MKPFRQNTGSVLRINMHLLMSFACDFTAWAIWPQSPEWWGFGLIAMILGVGGLTEFVKALRSMAALFAKAKALADYEAQGGRPKSAQMVSTDDLRRAGMLDE